MAQTLPAGLDKANAIVIDTTKGRVIFKLRPTSRPSMPSASSVGAGGLLQQRAVPSRHRRLHAQTADGKNSTAPAARKYPNVPASSPTRYCRYQRRWRVGEHDEELRIRQFGSLTRMPLIRAVVRGELGRYVRIFRAAGAVEILAVAGLRHEASMTRWNGTLL